MTLKDRKALILLESLENNVDDDCSIIEVHFRVSKYELAPMDNSLDLNRFMFWIQII